MEAKFKPKDQVALKGVWWVKFGIVSGIYASKQWSSGYTVIVDHDDGHGTALDQDDLELYKGESIWN